MNARKYINRQSELFNKKISGFWSFKKSALAALLAFVLHPKPKVRKAAQKAVALLVHSEGVSIVAVEEVATFVANELKRATKDQHTLQLLTFLRVVIYMFSSARQKEICQVCLRLQVNFWIKFFHFRFFWPVVFIQYFVRVDWKFNVFLSNSEPLSVFKNCS